MSSIDREALIREAAYTLWNEAGRPAGDGVAFWLSAERELQQREHESDTLQETLEESFPASDPPAGSVTSVGIHPTHPQQAVLASTRPHNGAIDRDLLERSAALLRHWPRQAKAAVRERHELLEGLNKVEEAFQSHIRNEESNGTAAELLGIATRAEHPVSVFKSEHAELALQLDLIIAEVASKTTESKNLVRQRQEFERWMEHVKRHKRAECDLLVEVLETDLGAGD